MKIKINVGEHNEMEVDVEWSVNSDEDCYFFGEIEIKSITPAVDISDYDFKNIVKQIEGELDRG